MMTSDDDDDDDDDDDVRAEVTTAVAMSSIGGALTLIGLIFLFHFVR